MVKVNWHSISNRGEMNITKIRPRIPKIEFSFVWKIWIYFSHI